MDIKYSSLPRVISSLKKGDPITHTDGSFGIVTRDEDNTGTIEAVWVYNTSYEGISTWPSKEPLEGALMKPCSYSTIGIRKLFPGEQVTITI